VVVADNGNDVDTADLQVVPLAQSVGSSTWRDRAARGPDVAGKLPSGLELQRSLGVRSAV
jgi:hypothetical protein